MKILLTGANSKIGLKLVECLQKQPNYELILHYAHENQGFKKLKNLIKNHKAHIFKCDFQHDQAIKGFCSTIKDEVGDLDAIVSLANIFGSNQKVDKKKMMQINHNAKIMMSNSFKSNIIKNAGIIIHFLDYISFAKQKNIPENFSDYIEINSEIARKIPEMALEFAPGRVNAIALGHVLENENERNFLHNAQNNLLQKKVNLTEIYNAVDFLLQNHSITGQVLKMDAGKHLTDLPYYE